MGHYLLALQNVDVKMEHKILVIWIVGSVITLGVAYALFRMGHKLDAASLIFWSPFPCPTGLPC